MKHYTEHLKENEELHTKQFLESLPKKEKPKKEKKPKEPKTNQK